MGEHGHFIRNRESQYLEIHGIELGPWSSWHPLDFECFYCSVTPPVSSISFRLREALVGLFLTLRWNLTLICHSQSHTKVVIYEHWPRFWQVRWEMFS